MELKLIEDELDRVRAKLAVMQERERELMEKRRVILSQRWIEVNAVKRTDVYLSSVDVGHSDFMSAFEKSGRKYIEYNGCIFAFVRGHLTPTDGYVSELKV